MKFGVHLVAAGEMIEGEKIARVAMRAEELGYDSLWVSDHIVFPTELASPYPYSPDGKLPLNPDNPFLEPFTVLSYAAAVTKRIKIGTSVAIIPYRDPIVTAWTDSGNATCLVSPAKPVADRSSTTGATSAMSCQPTSSTTSATYEPAMVTSSASTRSASGAPACGDANVTAIP